MNCDKKGHFAGCCSSNGEKRQKGKCSVNKVATSEPSDTESDNDDHGYNLFSLFESDSKCYI